MPFETKELQKFTQAGKAIADTMGQTFEVWAMGEASIICKQWMAHIPIANPQSVLLGTRSRSTKEAQVRSLAKFGITANTGRKGGKVGRIWYRTKGKKFQIAGDVTDDGQFVPANMHFKDGAWSRISTGAQGYARILPGMIKAGKEAIGLARNSVLQIMESLGVTAESVNTGGGDISSADLAAVRSAKPSSGALYLNGYAVKESSGNKFSVTLINRYPRIRESRIDVALDEVLAQRLAYQQSNLSLQVEGDMRKLAQAYPYLAIK